MSPRSLLILIVVTLVALVAAIVLVFVTDDTAVTHPEAGEPMFPAFDERIDDLARLEIETAQYSIALEQRDNVWVATTFGDYPIKSDPLAQIIGALNVMTKVEPKTTNPDWYGFIDVGDPSDPETATAVHVKAIASDGDTLLDAYLGIQSSSIGFSRFGGSFVRPVDDEQAWLVEGVVRAPSFLQDWFDTLFGIPGPDIAGITISRGDEMLFQVEKVDFDTADYELRFLADEVGPAEAEADDARIRNLTQGIVSAIFDSARAIDTISFTPDDRVLEFVTRDGLELTVRLTLIDDVYWVTYSATAEEGSEAVDFAAEINSKTDRWAFQIPSYRIDSLNRPIEELITVPSNEPAVVDPNAPRIIMPDELNLEFNQP